MGEQYAPRLQTTAYKMNLARAALKHVPGSEQLINETFTEGIVKPEIKPQRVENLVFHDGVAKI